MHSPPSSPGLFFSSPPYAIGTGPGEEVEALFASAREVKMLNESLSAIISANKAAFLNVFSRQVQLLKSRSQAFEDAHVTVYDKVLLLLTRNGNELESPAAIAWYCAEYLGVVPDIDANHGDTLVEQAIALPTAISQALTPLPSRKNSGVTAIPTDSNCMDLLEKSRMKGDPVFVRLWTVYSKAHTDYLAVADKRDGDAFEAARFLRDTAENGIHYLRDKYPKDAALTELTDTYNMAKMAVVNLNGGKKRKFDKAMEYHGKNTGTGRPNTAAHKRASFDRRTSDKGNRGKGKKRGRGPSGIPYGYTRPVDSYYPA